VNAEDTNGWTALRYALLEQHADAVELLAAHGTDLAAKDSEGETVFTFTMRTGRSELAKLLKRYGAG